MATSDVKVTPGSGANIASYSFTEDAETKQVGRVVLNASAGTEVGTSGAPLRTDPTGATTQPVSIATAPVLVAGSAVIGKVGIDQTTPGTTNKVSIGTDGTIAINAAVPAGTNLIGKVGIDQTTPGTTNKVSIGTDGTVAVNAAIPAGTNIIGKVTTDQTTHGTTDLVSADITKVAGAAISQGHGTAAAAIRVELPTDGTGVVTDAASSSTGSAVPAKASYVAGLAKTALPSAASDGNLTGPMFDKFGRQVVLPVSIRDLVGTQTTTISASTTETTIVTAGAAGIFNDLVMLVISNTSASTNTRIDFRDTTGGTILFSLESIGGAAPIGFALPIPIPQTSTATNWTAQCATSTTDVRVYAVFAKNK